MGTVSDMPSNYALKARSDALVANIRSLPDPCTVPGGESPLGTLLSLPVAAPRFQVPLTTRLVDASGRISARIGGRTVAEWLGWAQGTLEVTLRGHWAVCRPETSPGAPSERAQRFSSQATITENGRIRLPKAVMARLGTADGGELMVHVDPERGFVAFCNPGLIFTGAALVIDEGEN